MPAPIDKHVRVNDSWLGFLERPALGYLVARLPAWASPDHLTALGLLGSVLSAASYALCHLDPAFLHLATLGFVVNWFGDSLDGTLARYRSIERPKFGFFIDHAVDAICVWLTFVGFGISPYFRLDVALFGVAVYLMLECLACLRTCVSGQFQITYNGVGPTELRAAICTLNLMLWLFGPGSPSWFGLTPADMVMTLFVFSFYITYIVSFTQQVAELRNIDRVAFPPRVRRRA